MTRNNRLSNYKTTVVHGPNGELSVVYHNTEIVKRLANGTIILNTGGYRSATTKKKMNQASQQFNLSYSIYQKKGQWYVDDARNGWTGHAFGETKFEIGYGYAVNVPSLTSKNVAA